MSSSVIRSLTAFSSSWIIALIGPPDGSTPIHHARCSVDMRARRDTRTWPSRTLPRMLKTASENKCAAPQTIPSAKRLETRSRPRSILFAPRIRRNRNASAPFIWLSWGGSVQERIGRARPWGRSGSSRDQTPLPKPALPSWPPVTIPRASSATSAYRSSPPPGSDRKGRHLIDAGIPNPSRHPTLAREFLERAAISLVGIRRNDIHRHRRGVVLAQDHAG